MIETWRTEGIRPGVVAARITWVAGVSTSSRATSAGRPVLADLEHEADRWDLRLRHGVEPFPSADPDPSRVWWTDTGVHQNLTFPRPARPGVGHALLVAAGDGHARRAGRPRR